MKSYKGWPNLRNTILIPRHSRFFPNASQRQLSAQRNVQYQKGLFKSYNDWFYFIHIDPAQRYLHSFGMFVGIFFFAMIFIEWSKLSFIFYILGVFFFYVLGIISHLIYDKGTARSEPKFFISTLLPVISINITTLLGSYDHNLREFIKRYPFVLEAYDLIEIDKRDVLSHMFGSTKKRS